jgi:hypothetical protein
MGKLRCVVVVMVWATFADMEGRGDIPDHMDT